jgi:ATP-dependent DNA ligase
MITLDDRLDDLRRKKGEPNKPADIAFLGRPSRFPSSVMEAAGPVTRSSNQRCARAIAFSRAASRRTVLSNFEGLSVSKCPFRNLPESGKGRGGEGLNVDYMKRCRWVRPQLVAAIEFLEWTVGGHLRHPKFVGLRDDRAPREVVREM